MPAVFNSLRLGVSVPVSRRWEDPINTQGYSQGHEKL